MRFEPSNKQNLNLNQNYKSNHLSEFDLHSRNDEYLNRLKYIK